MENCRINNMKLKRHLRSTYSWHERSRMHMLHIGPLNLEVVHHKVAKKFQTLLTLTLVFFSAFVCWYNLEFSSKTKLKKCKLPFFLHLRIVWKTETSRMPFLAYNTTKRQFLKLQKYFAFICSKKEVFGIPIWWFG